MISTFRGGSGTIERSIKVRRPGRRSRAPRTGNGRISDDTSPPPRLQGPETSRRRSEWALRGSSSLEPAFGLSASQRPTDQTFTSAGFFCGPRAGDGCGTAPRCPRDLVVPPPTSPPQTLRLGRIAKVAHTSREPLRISEPPTRSRHRRDRARRGRSTSPTAIAHFIASNGSGNSKSGPSINGGIVGCRTGLEPARFWGFDPVTAGF